MATHTEVKVHGYEEYCREVDTYRGRTVFALFCGDKNEEGVDLSGLPIDLYGQADVSRDF